MDKMLVNVVENDGNIRNSRKYSVCYITILFVSLLSIITDIVVGLALMIQYYMHGKPTFAIFTFSFMFIPSIMIQILSIKLHFIKNEMKAVQWILHFLLLGLIYRYVTTIKKYVINFSSANYFQSESVIEDRSNLKNLYLYKCFMESVPQLILQLFIAATSNNLLLTRLSLYISVLSLAWTLTIHTKLKKGTYCSLMWLIFWRIGMITARVTALVLCSYICGPWMILFMGSHWLAMILWIIYQKSAANENKKRGEFHSATIYGLIYCFCFFSLKFKQSKWQAITLNLLFFFQNFIFLSVFLMRFSTEEPKLAVMSFVGITFGSLIGFSSLLLYYMLFNPNGSYKCTCPMKGILCGKRGSEREISASQEEQNRETQLYNNSVIVIEENPVPDSNNEGKLEISEAKVENIYEEPDERRMGNEAAHLNLPAAIKRRAICSSVDLNRFMENRTGDPEMEGDIIISDETPSEILSTRDYENICAVNIAREPWGIRSWRAYSDIETLRHDDSVVNEGRLDNLTTSSEYSGKFEEKDSFISEDKCDIDAISEKASINFLSPTSNTLEAIIEEEATESNPLKNYDKECKCVCKSTLVATIDKICLYTPLRTRSRSICNISDNAESCRMFRYDRKNSEKFSVSKNETCSPLRDRFRPVQKLNIFKEQYETNRYHVTSKSSVITAQENKTCTDKENFTKEDNQQIKKVKSENNTTSKAFSFRERGHILKEIFTPSKSEKCNFHISHLKG